MVELAKSLLAASCTDKELMRQEWRGEKREGGGENKLDDFLNER
jgi:hypothetical protein